MVQVTYEQLQYELNLLFNYYNPPLLRNWGLLLPAAKDCTYYCPTRAVEKSLP
jgi:hypothetical protein